MVLKKSKAWKVFSLHIRQRDKRCYTCGKGGDYRESDAGHYFHNCSIMFFEPLFVRRQCTSCNRFRHGRLGIYAMNLIGEIGLKAFKKAERKSHQIKRWKPQELKDIEKKYK